MYANGIAAEGSSSDGTSGTAHHDLTGHLEEQLREAKERGDALEEGLRRAETEIASLQVIVHESCRWSA